MQKSLFTLLMLVLGASATLAQTEKGRWTVGAQVGNFSYASSGPDAFRSHSFSASLSPSAGYFVARNLVVGVAVPVSYFNYRSSFSQPNTPGTTINSTQVGLSPFVRLYFGDSKLRPFVDATAGVTRLWYTTTNLNTIDRSESTSNQLNYSGSVGLAYFINNTVSLDAALGYQRGGRLNGTGILSGDQPESGSLGLNIGFRLFLGR